MRKLLTWLVVTLGIAALVRRLRRRRERAEPSAVSPEEPEAPDPADELRQKLAESRQAETTEEPSAAAEGTVEGRRAEVHEQGRAALDEMRSSSPE